jgi:hypothetical protein
MYTAGKSAGRKVACGYHRISHAEAEEMLLAKVRELGIQYEELRSDEGRKTIVRQINRLQDADETEREKWHEWLSTGVAALVEYMREEMGVQGAALQRIEKMAASFYRWGKVKPEMFKGLPLKLQEFKEAVDLAEEADMMRARQELARLDDEHGRYTFAFAQATPEMVAKLKARCTQLEEEMERWRPRQVRLRERFAGLATDDVARQEERERLEKEWPTMDNREKGEAMKRLFTKVTLYWEQTFHPAAAKPTRPHRTKRAGRHSYTLQIDRISWGFADCKLASQR